VAAFADVKLPCIAFWGMNALPQGGEIDCARIISQQLGECKV
jgi:hypothetical protein